MTLSEPLPAGTKTPAPPELPLGARAPSTSALSRLLIHRLMSLLAVLSLFWPEFKAWDQIIAVPSAGLAAIALVGGTLVLAVQIASASDRAALERLDRWLVALGLLVLAAYVTTTLNATSGYSSDEAAFTQAASGLLLHGHDPYGANLLTSLYTYGVPPQFWTYGMNGVFGTQFGYPALPMLVTAPITWVTGNGQAVPIAGMIAVLATLVVMFRALPDGFRGLAVLVCVSIPVLPNFALAGLNGVYMLPFLVYVAAGWREAGSTGRLLNADRRRAAALGLAAAASQISWFVAPFVLIGIFVARRAEFDTRRAAALTVRFAAITSGVFVLVNVPFIVWGPGAWTRTIAEPLIGHALPYGQGLIGLAAFMNLGGGHLALFALAGALLFLALLGWFALRGHRFPATAFLLPGLALFAGSRSLAEYWMLLVPAALVAVAHSTVPEGRHPSRWPGRGARWLPAALFAPAAACLVLAVLSPSPLRLQVLRAQSETANDTVSRVWVQVTNHGSTLLTPWFATDLKGQASAPWRVVSGPRQLAPDVTSTYVISAPSGELGPVNGATFVVHAFTARPETVSTSSRYAQGGPVPASLQH